MGKPISEKHAIEVASFIVVFEHPFEANIIAALPGLHAKLKGDYPVFNPTNTMEVRVEGADVSQNAVLSGGLFQSLLPDRRPSWTLRVQDNTIVVSCTDYKRWGDVSTKALNHIKAAITFVNSETNAVSNVIYQIVYRFVADSQDKYNINQVFQVQSPYLTAQVVNAGRLWHVYQGWFEDKEKFNGKLLNVLNLSTAENPVGITTTIDHAAHLRFSSPKAIGEFDDIFIRNAFDELHKCNKSIIRNLLTSDQLKAIGLV